MDLNLASFLCLELRDLLGDVSLEQDGVAPFEVNELPLGLSYDSIATSNERS